jgi:hypothetical protein
LSAYAYQEAVSLVPANLFLDGHSATGAIAGVSGGTITEILVSAGYTFGNTLTDSATFASSSFASLGLTPGTYTYTYTLPSDSLVVQIGPTTPVTTPEPTSFALLGAGLAGMIGIGWRPRS